jgi:Uma2 family endonuclease
MAKKKIAPNEQRVVLPNTSWAKFEEILQELGDDRQVRLTYLRGKLEMMTPVVEHDRCRRLINSLILVVADELKRPVEAIAPVTLKSRDFECATEPDACYRFPESGASMGAEAEGDRTEILLPGDSSPDLLVEVALTKSKINKMPIYATLGIPEVWRYITTAGEDVLEGKVIIYGLEADSYVECHRSRVLPFLSGDRILEFLNQSDTISLAAALKVLRAWMQEQ